MRAINPVPFGHAGFLRRVYPGFLQLAGFMAMNLDRHIEAHWQMFHHLVEGDGESLAAKRAFYEEYKAVMDLPADYYL
jgi:poly(3-hydroxybutyrate) depolymerase